MTRWLLLAYRIPREPTAPRVFVWRKLKKLGAVPLQDAVWVLPDTPRTLEHFQWLAAEITELKGDAVLWSAQELYATNPQALQAQFTEPIAAEYRSILAELKKIGRDLALLSQRFLDVQARDYFALELGQHVRKKLLAMGKGKTK